MLRLLFLLATLAASNGGEKDPFHSPAQVRVLLFVRTDCPITNRYAPELKRIASEYQTKSVRFWMVYPDRGESAAHVENHRQQYQFPGTWILDPRHELVARAHATVAPEAAVFDEVGRLLYHGRIDNRWADIGKSRPVATVHDLEGAIELALQGRAVVTPSTRAIGCSLADVE